MQKKSKNDNLYSERIACSSYNKKRLIDAMEIYMQYHPEARHRNITYNEALGIILDFYYKESVIINNNGNQ